METRSSTQSYTTSDSKVAVESREKDQVPSNTERSDDLEGGPAARKSSFFALIGACWCLILHYILSVGVAMLVLFAVEGHHFNVTERIPLVQVVEGTKITRFLPMQSDVVTFLSSVIAILKFTLSAWAVSLCWNTAFFLMERRGLTRRDLKALLKYGLLAPGAYSRDWSTITIGLLLLATLVGHLSSPILTGSISWVPSNRLVHDLTIDPIEILGVEDHSVTAFPSDYKDDLRRRQDYVLGAMGVISNSWGSDPEKGIFKRITTTLGRLNVNSTVEKFLLPYFEVQSIRWIENQDDIPGIRDGVDPDGLLFPHFDMAPIPVTSLPVGYAIMIPNVTANWSSDPLDSTIIRDTRLLVLNYGYNEPTRIWTLTAGLPPGAYIRPHHDAYLAFAWVTFSAGIGRCGAYNCVIDSPSIIRNNTPFELEPHQLTVQALSLALNVGIQLVTANMSLPSAWENLNGYVEAVLVRSYSGAWSIMDANFLRLGTAIRYVPSLPSLLAQVNYWRIYMWLGIQLLVTILSIMFLVAQSHLSKYPLIGDTALTAFDMDTTAIPVDDVSQAVNRARKIESRGDKLTVKDESR